MTGRLLAGLLLALLATAVSADDPKLPDVATFDRLVVDALRDAHNTGADLYNTKKEFDGTYRLYQGALMTVRPLLAHRPKAQQIIDDGIQAAEKEASTAQRAFKLHEAIEAVRTHLKASKATPPTDAKKPGDAKKPADPTVAPPPREKKIVDKP